MSSDRLETTRAILADLIAFPTVSHAPNRAMIDALADRLEAAGARVEIFESEEAGKANLWATIGPEREGGIVLSGHTDVVPTEGQDWASDPFEMRDDGERLFGRGSCDMKGFLAACLATAPDFAARAPERPLHFAFTHDEEVGCLGARALIEVLRAREARPALAIIGEPTEMALIEGHKGCHEYTTRFCGLAGHGSDPAAGVNAAEYAVRYAARLMALRADLARRAPADSPFTPPETTINLGRLAGGIAHNVIADTAEIEWEMRPVQAADAEFVKAELARLVDGELLPEMRARHAGAVIETLTVGEVPGLATMEENAARDLVAELTGANAAGTVAFGTEAGLFQRMGLDAVICGPGSIREAHKANEFVSRDQLAQCLAMLERLGTRLGPA